MNSVEPSTVADLTRNQAAAVPGRALPLLPAWLYALATPFAGLIAEHVVKVTGKIAALDIWFKGAMAAVVNAPAESFIDDDGSLLFALEELESKLLGSRARILKLVRRLEKLGGNRVSLIRDAFHLYAQASADVFETVRAYGWAVLEHDANADVAARRIYGPFGPDGDLKPA